MNDDEYALKIVRITDPDYVRPVVERREARDKWGAWNAANDALPKEPVVTAWDRIQIAGVVVAAVAAFLAIVFLCGG